MKSLVALALRRPVATAAVYVLVIALAAIAWVRLPVALLPELNYPAVTVWTPYSDVPPARVEESITRRVEEAVAGTEGVREISSRSQLGGSLVQLRFGWNADLDRALLNVREQLDRISGALPEEAERPLVLRLDPSDRPIMMIGLQEGGRAGPEPEALQAQLSPLDDAPQDLVALRQVGEEVVARRLEQLSDVARVRVTGGYDRQVEIRLNEDQLNAYNLSLDDIGQSLDAANVALPGGMIQRGPFRYAVEVSGEFESADDVGRAVVGRAGEAAIRFSDVADVRMSVQERRGLVRLDGRETLLMLVERRPDANTVRAAEEVREALAQLDAELPQSHMRIVVDESTFIQDAIGGVTQAVMWGGLLAILVLFFFLRRPRSLVAVGAAVPLSLAITLALFEFMGITFNLISLSGLALGVGMLIDNAIVVTENIARHREEGKTPSVAALVGTQEVAGAITASTLTTIAVFLPLTFVEGLAGRLFRDQSLAVVASLLASLIVALTAVPLLAARDRGDLDTGWGHSRMLKTYERGLSWSLAQRGAVMAICAILLVGAAIWGVNLPREVIPQADQGRVDVRMSLPPDADVPLLASRAADFEQQLYNQEIAASVLTDLGERREARLELDPRPPYQADFTILLPDDLSAEEATQRIRTMNVPVDQELEVRPAETQLEALLTTGDADIMINLASDDRARAEEVTARVLRDLQQSDALADVRRADAAEVPAYQLRLNRDAMARMGAAGSDVTAYLDAAARGRQATELRTISEEIPIVLRAAEAASIDRILAARVPTENGGLIPLRTFVDAEMTTVPAALSRSEQAPVVQLLADIPPNSDLAAAESAIHQAFEGLPTGVRGEVLGAGETFREGLQAVAWSLLLSILLVYLILAAQFERLIQPFIILAAVPLAAAGVALAIGVFGQTINLMSLTGCVVLVGIVVNDAIIKVDLINQRRDEGMSLEPAIKSAGADRLRPILMTSVTTGLGLLPLAIGLGAGAELRTPLAIAIIGGLFSATLLSLFAVPVLYRLLARFERIKPHGPPAHKQDALPLTE